MKLTRLGFNVVVLVFLAPLIFYDIWGNTNATGVMSDVFYYKTMFDGLLAAYAFYMITQSGHVQTRTSAQARVNDKNDEVVDFEHLGAVEYIYAAMLCGYALLNWWTLHGINAASTGFISMISLIWSFVSLGVAILSAIQFWHLKSGEIVAVKKKLVAS